MTYIPSNLLAKAKSTGVEMVSGNDFKADFDKRLHALFRLAVDEIKSIYSNGLGVVSACSFGKDSSCTLLAHLQAYEEYLTENPLVDPKSVPFIVTNIDTGVENCAIAMFTKYESERLKAHFDKKGWKLEYHTSTPPLSQSWASLFLSAKKLFSTPKGSNDCSVILKIDSNQRLIRSLMDKYGDTKFVTLLGSRLSESAARGNSIRKFNNDVNVEEAMVGAKKGLVYMPIREWGYDDVMGLLMRASNQGTPITKPIAGCEIPSYAPNHRMLKLIYGEASESSCPTSGHQIKGANKESGCGRSRFGCTLCLKNISDKSATHQNNRPRYSYIQGNMQKIRDYCAYVASDMNHRTFHSRAVDADMGYVVLQPNVLKASTIEYIAFQLMMATKDDELRVEKLKGLVRRAEQGDTKALMEDPGYADIMTDPALDIEDREILRQFYLQYAQERVITVFSYEQALFLDAIHSRDGVRLPPFRMTYLWEQVNKGARLPYPNVKLSMAKEDKIPDPKMLPIRNLSLSPAFRPSEVLEADMRNGCASSLNDDAMPYTLTVKRTGNEFKPTLKYRAKSVFLSDTLRLELANDIDALIAQMTTDKTDTASKKINIRYRRDFTLTHQVNPVGVQAERLQQWSRRQNVKISRSKGTITNIEKGRASVAFYNMHSKTKLERAHEQAVNFWMPSWSRTETYFDATAIEDMSDVTSGYAINTDAMYQWMRFDGLERALRTHNDFVARQHKNGRSRYYYANTQVFEHLTAQGVIEIADHVVAQSQRICDRTEMFNQMGLFGHKDSKALAKLGVDMAQYRTEKASKLLAIRKLRNAKRALLRSQLETFNTAPSTYVKSLVNNIIEPLVELHANIAKEHVLLNAMHFAGETGFDDVAVAPRLKTTTSWLEDVVNATQRVSSFMSVFCNQHIRKALSNDYELTMWLDTRLTEVRKTLDTQLNASLTDTIGKIEHGVQFNEYWTWMFSARCAEDKSLRQQVTGQLGGLMVQDNSAPQAIPVELTNGSTKASKLDTLLGLC